MKNGVGSKLIVAIALMEMVATPAFAEDRHPLAYVPHPLVFNSIAFSQQHQKDPTIYERYVEERDPDIKQWYLSREQDFEARGNSNNPVQSLLVDGSTVRSTNVVFYEMRMRNDLASAVLRGRLENAIRTYANSPDSFSPLGAAIHTTEAVRDYKVSLSSDEKTPAQLKLGYDVMSDVSHLGFSNPSWELMVVVPQFMSAFIPEGASQLMGFQFTSRLGVELPTASVGWQFKATSVQMGLSQALSRTVSTNISTSQPIGLEPGSSYELRFMISF